jgi:ATP-dependent Lon protease
MAKSNLTSFDNLTLQDIEAEAELIPLLTTEDEEALRNEDLPPEVPILPLRNTVLFPGVVIPITAGRDKSIQLIKDANNSEKVIGVVAQKDKNIENPWPR